MMTSGSPVRIQTPRLLLRDHIAEDAPCLHRLLSDASVTWYLPSMRKNCLSQAAQFVSSCIADISAIPRLRYNLAVILPDAKRSECETGGRLIGEVGLHLIDGDIPGGHWGLGYFMDPDIWNRGYGAEAARAALDFIFEQGVFRVSASCLAENLSSRRVLEKCGMIQEALLRHHTLHDGQWKDCAVYRLLARERSSHPNH